MTEKKKHVGSSDITQVSDDFDIFEELEGDKNPEQIEGATQGAINTDQNYKMGAPVPEGPAIKDSLEEAMSEVRPPKHEKTAPVFQPVPQENAATVAQGLADELAVDVPVNLVAVIGKTTVNVAELSKFKTGDVVELGRSLGETVDIVANGRLIAKGELVDMDGKMGVRLIKMLR